MHDDEVAFWNTWNAHHREASQGDVSIRQAEVVLTWLAGGRDLRILEAGCGTGWLCESLVPLGEVVGTDLADEVIERARERVPDATFVAGDIMNVDVGDGFDVVVTLEVLSHVPDQPAFMERLASVLRPGGRLVLATQNRPVLERANRIPPPGPGQRRRWVDRRELRRLAIDAGFRVDRMETVSPKADHGLFRVIAKAGRVLRCTRVLERCGFGWTIMMSATKVSDVRSADTGIS